MGIFEGLENFGIKNVKDVDVYKKEEEKAKKEAEKVQQKKQMSEEDYVFDKTYTCPVCDKEFKSKQVRTGKARLIGADSDLRPKYQGIDSLKYDAIMCPKCGYAALNRYFSFVMPHQAKSIKEKISASFKADNKETSVYSYDDAIAKHKMALLNTVVKNGKNSERAYTCLKLAWLYRGKREEVLEVEHDKDDINNLVDSEMELLQNAYEGFEAAYSTEDFPMCGMDRYTMLYLLAELARRIGKTDASMRFLSQVLVARDASSRIKNRAIELKETLMNDKKKKSAD